MTVKSHLHASSPPGETQPEQNCLHPAVQDHRFNLLEWSIRILIAGHSIGRNLMTTELDPALSSTPRAWAEKETPGQADVLGQGHKTGLRAVTRLAVTVQIQPLILLILTNPRSPGHHVGDLEGNQRNHAAPNDGDDDSL